MTDRPLTNLPRLPVPTGQGAEKFAALRTARYFTERRACVVWDAFDRLMVRQGGAAPRPGDEMPDR